MLPFAHQYPNTLSGGQQQRVGIARALAVNPHIMLLDEPTSALDPKRVIEVSKIIQQLAKSDRAMILVTHEMKLVEKIATQVIFMADGKILEIGSTEDVLYRTQNPIIKNFLNHAE